MTRQRRLRDGVEPRRRRGRSRRPRAQLRDGRQHEQQPGVGAEQRADVLARLERAHEQNGAVGLRPTGRGGHGGAPGEQTVMRSRGTPNRVTTSPAVKRETATIASARRACARGQVGVVAANLAARTLGVIQKVEVVNRHDPRGRARVGISSGEGECATSSGPASHSTGGNSSRCHEKLSSRTGTRASTIARARDDGPRSGGPSRSSRRASACRRRGAGGRARRRARGRIRRRRCARGARADSPAECALAAMVAQRVVATTPYTSIN